jgi:cytoskeleton protein RodZ
VSVPDTPEAALPENAPAIATVSAGAMLAHARESAGLTIDAVAQQLKLAPRQIKALEADDFGALPGRTFVRGFVRNYARLLRVDPAVALAALPDAIAAPALDRPVLTSSPRSIGEIPADDRRKPGIARWAIPLALIAVVAVAVVYEVGRPALESKLAEPAKVAVAPAAPATPPAATPASAESTALPNPLATPADPLPAPATGAPVTEPGLAPQPTDAPPGETTLEFSFRGKSWVEVRDTKGAIIMSTMGTRGATQAVTSAPPIDIVVGNATEVDVTYGGTRIDTAPYLKQNVARLRLPLAPAATK